LIQHSTLQVTLSYEQENPPQKITQGPCRKGEGKEGEDYIFRVLFLVTCRRPDQDGVSANHPLQLQSHQLWKNVPLAFIWTHLS